MKKVLLVLAVVLLTACTGCRKQHSNVNEGGIYSLTCTLDDCVTIPFIVDTGASETTIPYYVALTLFKAEKIKKEDILESRTYILADGSLMRTDRVKIHKMVIGNHEFREFSVSISDNPNSPILLGQNVLSQLKYMKINYEDNTIILE
jgi:predicted aspartyl protease